MKITEVDLDKLSKSLSQVRLSDDQKSQMLSSIYAAESAAAPVRSPIFVFSVFTGQRLVATFAMFMFALVSTGYAAAGSLPGQLLYGIKVNVLEPAALKMTLDEEERNGYRVHLLQTRVAEMRELQLRAGIDVESETASRYATERNIHDLEASAIFNAEGDNLEVRTEVEAYNSLISEPLRIETTLLKEKVLDIVEDEEADPKKERKKPTEDLSEEVEEVVTKTETTIKQTARETTKTVEEVVTAAEEVVEETKVAETVEDVADTVEKVTKPVTDIIGL